MTGSWPAAKRTWSNLMQSSFFLSTCLTTHTLAFGYVPITHSQNSHIHAFGPHAFNVLQPGSTVKPYFRKQSSAFRKTLLKAEDHLGSSSISLRARIDYFVERLLSKGTLTQVLVLVFLSSLIVACGALLIWIAALGSGSVEYAISKSYLLLFRFVDPSHVYSLVPIAARG